MIYVDLRNSDFYDDAQVLIKSFYPRMQTSLLKDDSRLTDEDTVIYADTSMCEGVSKKEAHDRFLMRRSCQNLKKSILCLMIKQNLQCRSQRQRKRFLKTLIIQMVTVFT